MTSKQKVKILYKNDDILIINKPAGLLVHSDGITKEETLVDWLLQNFPETSGVGEGLEVENREILRSGIVHRLDRDTSGVLVVARNQSTYKYLKKLFKERMVKKVYWALVYGQLKNNSGIIDRPVGRGRFDFKVRATGSMARGELREAVTYYKVLKRFRDYSLLELRPKTGRTHQLRVHLKSISHPIVCDPIYASGKICIGGLSRQALHAKLLEFKLSNGTQISIEAPLPDDFKTAIDNLERL